MSSLHSQCWRLSSTFVCMCMLVSMCVCKHRFNYQCQVQNLICLCSLYNATFLSSLVTAARTVTELHCANEISAIPRNENDIVSHCFMCLCPKQPSSSTCWVSKPLSPHSVSVPSLHSLLLLQMGQRPRGLHYKQQIKGLPLIRCQGQRGALPVLAMIQYLLICCALG